MGKYKSGNSDDSLDALMNLTGLSYEECVTLMNTANWDANEANHNMQILFSGAGVAAEKTVIENAIREAGLYSKLGDQLANLNTMRGGINGFKGFVAEPLEATNATISGKTTVVLDNNGVADLAHIGKNGHYYYKQVKIGYKPGQIDFAKYKGQTVIIDKGNPYFKQLQAEANKSGVKVIEGSVTNEEAKSLANKMQAETKVTGQKHSHIVTQGVKAEGLLKSAHKAGIKTGKTGAVAGAGFSSGQNMVKIINGDKEIEDAVADIAKDTAVAGAVSYGVGAATTIIGSTTTGAAALGVVSSAATTIAGTTVGGAAVAGATAIGGAGATVAGAAVGAVGTVGGAIGSAAVSATAGTVVGGAVASGVTSISAGAATIGAFAVSAAPVFVIGAALGTAWELFFGDDDDDDDDDIDEFSAAFVESLLKDLKERLKDGAPKR